MIVRILGRGVCPGCTRTCFASVPECDGELPLCAENTCSECDTVFWGAFYKRTTGAVHLIAVQKDEFLEMMQEEGLL